MLLSRFLKIKFFLGLENRKSFTEMESGLVVPGPVGQDFMGLAMSSDHADNGNKISEKRPLLERSESQAIPSTSTASGHSCISDRHDNQGKQTTILFS